MCKVVIRKVYGANTDRGAAAAAWAGLVPAQFPICAIYEIEGEETWK